MYLQIKGVTTWDAPVDLIIEAQHRWPVDDRGRVDLTPPADWLDEEEDWFLECEPGVSKAMYLHVGGGAFERYDWFDKLTVREAPPDQVNKLIGAPMLPGFDLPVRDPHLPAKERRL